MSIEEYFHAGPGYNPFLCRQDWQVAQLNFLPLFSAPNIRRVERHAATDEAFILVRGASVLVAANELPDGLVFEAHAMKAGVTYNIPLGVWHTIAMQPDDLVIVVEKAATHLNDVTYRNLSEAEYLALQKAITA